MSMHIVDFPEYPPRKNAVVTIGNMDGVHIGHQTLIDSVVQTARERNCVSALVTFDPHPQEILFPNRKIARLSSREHQLSLLERLGIDIVFIIPFTKSFSQLTPKEFIAEFLQKPFELEKLFVGYDFYFGKQRSGNAETLKEIGEQDGFEVEVIAPIEKKDSIVSSSRLRQLAQDCQFSEMASLLGREFSFYGEVRQGDQRGRTIGFPTLNLLFPYKIPVPHGVYAVKVHLKGKQYFGVTNIGVRPTFEKTQLVIETFVFDFDQEVYGEMVEIIPLAFIRHEKKFNSLEELMSQIKNDAETAKEMVQQVTLH